MKFSKSNHPPGFYVYLYLRRDGTAYYCGKGKGSRAWDNHRINNRGVHTPPNNRIVIVAYNLSEVGSLAIERRLIRWYGREDVDYSNSVDPSPIGILKNKTDGGEGTCGKIKTTIYTFYHRDGRVEKCTLSHLCKKFKLNKGGLSEMINTKHSRRFVSGWSIDPNIQSNEFSEFLGGLAHPRADSNLYTFKHKDGRVVTLTRYEFRSKFNLNNGDLGYLLKGKRGTITVKSIKGWSLIRD